MVRGWSLVPAITLSVFRIRKLVDWFQYSMSILIGAICSILLRWSAHLSESDDTTIFAWDAASEPVTGRTLVTFVCFSPDSKQILSGSRENTICVWNSHTSQPHFPPFRGHADWVIIICFFPDGRDALPPAPKMRQLEYGHRVRFRMILIGNQEVMPR